MEGVPDSRVKKGSEVGRGESAEVKKSNLKAI